MRAFVGIPIPDDVKKQIILFQKELARSADVRLVEAQNLHFTMKFLGNISSHDVGMVVQKLKQIHWQPFSVELNGVGVFPNDKLVRVVWVGIKENPLFISLIKSVHKELSSFRKEDHGEIVAHLTVARVRSQRHLNPLLSLIQKFQKKEFGSFVVDHFILYKSILTEKGSTYTIVDKF